MAIVNTEDNPLFQSGYTYLQVAGSDGADHTVTGRHLKWDFLKSLGDQHLPKGDYTVTTPYASTSGFNRSGDFVNIYSVKYTGRPFHVRLFPTSQPGNIASVNGKWNWTYVLNVAGSSPVTTTTVRLIFTDTALYNHILTDMTPLTNWAEFIKRYQGVIEIHTDNKLAFVYEFEMAYEDHEYIRIEAVGVPDSLDPATKQLNVRKSYASGNPKFYSENTQYLRVQATAEMQSIYITTYEDFIVGQNGDREKGGEWETVGHFALTTETTVKNTRFMAPYIDGIYGQWPKFNDPDTVSGEFCVNKDNYDNRWERSGYTFNKDNESNNDKLGLRHFIHSYMKNSTTDPKATVALPSDDPEDDTVQVMSYLDMLRLLSLDFHLSRIMGMGHIEASNDEYEIVYIMEYITTAGLEAPNTSAITRSHLYMALPTKITDYRLPKAPLLDELSYGATIDNGTGVPTSLTDANGYTPQENLRFININRKPYQHEKALGTFFYENKEFVLADESQPVAYGLEYKEIGETDYRKPELNHDPDYLDHKDIPETMPILENGGPRLFTHQEENEGTHVYAAYAINWFSRVSPLSNTKQTTTLFPKICRMLPPFNYATQLIQDEDPTETIENKTLILTTVEEQEKLAGITEEDDHTLVRTTFDWNHVHNNAHPTADYAEFFFREEEPIVVKGKVISVEQIDADTAIVHTGSYQVTSSFPAQTVQPAIAAGDMAKFAGSLFSTGQSHYSITAIDSSGNNPQFRIQLLKNTQASAPDAGNQNQFIAVETVEMPQPGDLFFVIENMGEPANWDLKHPRRVYLQKHYTNAGVFIRYSPTNAVSYGIRMVEEVSGDTVIYLHEPIRQLVDTGASVEYTIRKKISGLGATQFKIPGNFVSDLPAGKHFRIFTDGSNNGLFTVTGTATYASGYTTIHTLEDVPDFHTITGIMSFQVNRGVSMSAEANSVTITGALKKAEMDIARIEYTEESDGSATRFVVGGITSDYTMQPLLDDNGNGTGYVQLFSVYNLLPHPDSNVKWSKGHVRLKDISGKTQVYPVSYIGNLTTTPFSYMALVIQDPGFVPANPSDPMPADTYTLDLNASQEGNFHPSYRVYLRSTDGLHPVTGAVITSGVQLKEAFTLPVFNDPMAGNKQTFMSTRAWDVENNLVSYLSPPTTILAQKINIPVAPGLPQGPLYATRPNFFGKSTYTFDTKINTDGGRYPYALIFYRSSNDAILDALYKKGTQDLIFAAWDELPPSFTRDRELWKILIEVIQDPSSPENFKNFVTTEGSFQWPKPDNPEFRVPFETTEPISTANYPIGGMAKPFAEELGLPLNTSPTVYGITTPAADLIKMAIQQSFTPMNEQPPLAAYIMEGKQTSPAPSVLRDTNGKLLDPLTNDIYPMVRKYENSGYVRFTDYHLDGASLSMYFYRVMELDDKFKLSPPGETLGPVVMVNSFAPEQPQIRKAITQLENQTLELPAAVLLELNQYPASEKISRLEIYRATNEIDALSVRLMKKVKTISWGDPVTDDFSDVEFPLYGEDLYYRMVAIREVEDVHDIMNTNTITTVEVPSRPSNVVRTTLVDPNNPLPPDITFVIGNATTEAFENVQLIWNATCYNGTYSLQKMNNSGNWVEVYNVLQTDGVVSYPPLDGSGNPDFAAPNDATVSIPRLDEDDQPIYHRYRVEVENSSGLFNLQHKEFILDEYVLAQQDNGTLDLEDGSGSLIL